MWHVPWTDKNDALDWQSYFHQRNRTIAALLHSPYEHGGRVVRESFNHQIKHLFSLQYSTAELRHLALEDVLAGPERLHAELMTKLPELQAKRKQYADAQKRFEAHQAQITRMAAADAEAALPTSYTSSADGEGGDETEAAGEEGAPAPARPAPAASGGTLASDEALQALREKLSGGGS